MNYIPNNTCCKNEITLKSTNENYSNVTRQITKPTRVDYDIFSSTTMEMKMASNSCRCSMGHMGRVTPSSIHRTHPKHHNELVNISDSRDWNCLKCSLQENSQNRILVIEKIFQIHLTFIVNVRLLGASKKQSRDVVSSVAGLKIENIGR